MHSSFIESYPELLLKLTKASEFDIKLIANKVQEVDLALFDNLKENDVLFIDYSHILKTVSDFQIIMFGILPRLKKSILVYFHDIFYPFEYPKEWVIQHNWAWNVIYVIRALLMYNSDFKVVIFNNYLLNKTQKWFQNNMPLCTKNHGGSIWL